VVRAVLSPRDDYTIGKHALPLEYEARLKELPSRQAQLNAALDLDKSDAQAAHATGRT
jgi:hypothetical protein